jgi:L-lactate utilization protein LutC
MTAARESFLSRVREAVRQGNRAGKAPVLPERGNVGYQGGGNDPVRCFEAECTAAGARVHLMADREAGASCIMALVQAVQARSVVLGQNLILEALDLRRRLASEGIAIVTADGSCLGERHYAADIAITGVDYLIAETGSLVVLARPDNPRSFTLLPPVHVAVAETSQLLPDLFDLFGPDVQPELPSCISFITGPSKTGDIELRLVTGVHGPGEVHVVLVT